MKKVVHLTSAHPRYDQRILWRECYSLREHGFDVILIVNDNQGQETLENGIRIISTGFVPNGRRQRMTEGVRNVFELGLAQDADIYHLHDPELLRIALKLKQHGKKVIFDSHEFYGHQIKTREYMPSFLRNIVANVYYYYETYICKQIDGVVIPFRYGGKDVFSGRTSRFAYVGNYPRYSEYEGISVPAYSSRQGLCYCGTLDRGNGISDLVQAGKKAGINILLAGVFSPPEYEQEILEKSNALQYLGYIAKRKDVFRIYSKCAIGANVARNVGQNNQFDGLPSKVYEYMAMSMPVVISRSAYRERLVDQYRFGLVANPNDVDDIAAKICWLVEHPHEAEIMGKNGKRLLEEKFTWEKGAEPELLRLYREIE